MTDESAIYNTLDIKFRYLTKYNLDFDSRTVYLTGDITERSTQSAIKSITLLNQISEDRICLVINSPGGVVDQAFALIDLIKTIPPYITGIGTGQVCSAALGILAACDSREATKYCTFMHHAASYDSGYEKVDIHSSLLAYVKKRDVSFNKLLAENTNKSFAFWASHKHLDYYFDSQDALDMGLISQIVP